MRITIEAIETIDTVQGLIPARIWIGQTDSGVPVKAWLAVIQPQTDDPALLESFALELKQVPMTRQLTSFDLRLVV
jgi:hypothetical protein